jgi:hypothetical protein
MSEGKEYDVPISVDENLLPQGETYTTTKQEAIDAMAVDYNLLLTRISHIGHTREGKLAITNLEQSFHWYRNGIENLPDESPDGSN